MARFGAFWVLFMQTAVIKNCTDNCAAHQRCAAQLSDGWVPQMSRGPGKLPLLSPPLDGPDRQTMTLYGTSRDNRNSVTQRYVALHAINCVGNVRLGLSLRGTIVVSHSVYCTIYSHRLPSSHTGQELDVVRRSWLQIQRL